MHQSNPHNGSYPNNTQLHFQTTESDMGSLPLEEDIASIYKVNDLFYNNKFDEVMEVTAVQ